MEHTTKRRGKPKGMTNDIIEARAAARMAERAATIPPGPGNKQLRPERQEEVRAKIQASHIVRRLQQCGDGVIELTPQQIKSYEILLSKSLASLQSTEVTEVSKNDKLSEAEILAKIGELIHRDPRLADLARMRQVVDVPVAPAGDTCGACGGEVQCGVCVACGALAGM